MSILYKKYQEGNKLPTGLSNRKTFLDPEEEFPFDGESIYKGGYRLAKAEQLQKGGDTNGFEKWYAKTSNALDLDPNYNSPLHYYDYKGFYNKYGNVDMTKGQHFTDEFKRPGHPTFSNQSKYSNTATPGGDWTQMDDKSFMFTHSPLTNKHYNRTAGYLQGTGERAALPTVNVYAKKK